MSLSRWKSMFPILVFCGLLLILVACSGGSSTTSATTTPTPMPTPTPGQGQRLLTTAAQKLNSASTLHGIFDVTSTSQTFTGTVETEVWNAKPDKSRTHVLQSTFTEVPPGSVTVTNGKQIWEYNPVKKVVYTGTVSNSASGTSSGFGSAGQNQLVLTLVQTVFTHSNATLVSSSANVAGHPAYQVHVAPAGQGISLGPTSFNYMGDVYIDKTTGLPLRINLSVTGIGQILVDIPSLILNSALPTNTFTFTPPPGTKVLPLQQANATPGADASSITLAQAEQQAGYHLLSIPSSQTAYQLVGVNALGAPGNQIYTLNYTRSGTSFTIIEGQPLANLSTVTGQKIPLRGTSAIYSSANGGSTLSWTENGVGIQIQGPMSKDDIVNIAKMLT